MMVDRPARHNFLHATNSRLPPQFWVTPRWWRAGSASVFEIVGQRLVEHDAWDRLGRGGIEGRSLIQEEITLRVAHARARWVDVCDIAMTERNPKGRRRNAE